MADLNCKEEEGIPTIGESLGSSIIGKEGQNHLSQPLDNPLQQPNPQEGGNVNWSNQLLPHPVPMVGLPQQYQGWTSDFRYQPGQRSPDSTQLVSHIGSSMSSNYIARMKLDPMYQQQAAHWDRIYGNPRLNPNPRGVMGYVDGSMAMGDIRKKGVRAIEIPKSGCKGVSWNSRMKAWLAFYVTENGERKSKTFSMRKLGMEEARIQAIAFCREKQEQRNLAKKRNRELSSSYRGHSYTNPLTNPLINDMQPRSPYNIANQEQFNASMSHAAFMANMNSATALSELTKQQNKGLAKQDEFMDTENSAVKKGTM